MTTQFYGFTYDKWSNTYTIESEDQELYVDIKDAHEHEILKIVNALNLQHVIENQVANNLKIQENKTNG